MTEQTMKRRSRWQIAAGRNIHACISSAAMPQQSPCRGHPTHLTAIVIWPSRNRPRGKKSNEQSFFLSPCIPQLDVKNGIEWDDEKTTASKRPAEVQHGPPKGRSDSGFSSSD